MYEDIKAPENFFLEASSKAAKIVILLNQLSNISYDKGCDMVRISQFGQLLHREETKAWFAPEYFMYKEICEEYGLIPSLPKEFYNYSDWNMLTDRLYPLLFPENRYPEAYR